MDLKINIKASTDQNKYEIEIKDSDTVLHLKQKILEKSSMPVEEQRLIYSGKVLKDPDTLSSYKIATGHTIHLVRSKPSATTPSPATRTTPANAPAPAPAPAMNPLLANNPLLQGQFGAPLPTNPVDNPLLSQMMQSMLQNPQMMQQMMQQNPMLAQMGVTPEQMTQMMQDPLFQSLMSNPQVIQAAMQQVGGMGLGGGLGSGLSGAGLGNLGAGAGGNVPAMNPFASLFGNTQPQASQEPPEIRFQTQLAQMQEMGFYDAQANIRALLATGGNVHAAIEYMFSNPQ